MKITKSQLKQIIKEELKETQKHSLGGSENVYQKYSSKEPTPFNLYEIEEIIDEMLGGRADSYLADQLQAWWDGLQEDPAFMELGKDPNDKFSGRKG